MSQDLHGSFRILFREEMPTFDALAVHFVRVLTPQRQWAALF
jgi:hypothetical protein